MAVFEDERPTGLGPTTQERANKLLLVAVVGSEVMEWDISQPGHYRVGRAPAAEVHIGSTSVSRNHAEIIVSDSGTYIRDFESTNRTFVNGEPVGSEARHVIPGDALRFGGVAAQLHGKRGLQRESAFVTPVEFEKRLSAEGERSIRSGNHLSALVLQVGQPTDLKSAQKIVDQRLRQLDVATIRNATRIDALVVDCDRAGATEIARYLIDQLADQGVTASAGTASYPSEAPSAETLVTSAHLAISDAQAGEIRAAKAGARSLFFGERPFVVADPSMIRLFGLVERLGSTRTPVLIYGETGTGKEILAEAIHHSGPRSGAALVKVNCAAIPHELLESELFGHEKGAFSGAISRRVGLVEQCDGGTLFLDEIADMPMALQAKLLRVVEDQRVRRVGSNIEVAVDVRVVAATHCDLKGMVADGTFREDLYFRLRGIELRIPPLRKRQREIVLLAELFLRNICREQGCEVLSLSGQAVKTLEAHDWPGNVRELRQVIESSVVLCEGTIIDSMHLVGLTPIDGPESADAPFSHQATQPGAILLDPAFSMPLSEEIRRLEIGRIEQALGAAGGNRTQAAKLLGMPRRTLMHKLSSLGMTKAAASSRD